MAAPLRLAAHCVRGEPIAYEDAVKRRFGPIGVGGAWGPPWGTTWFHVPGRGAPDRGGRELAEALRDAVPGTERHHHISAVGHAHIDTAWLWPMREAKRKCARTFSTALALMDEYPDFRFACSQPAQYAWMRESYPTIFEGIREKVAAGRWEPVGSMWIEADCNLPSGEALVRHFVHGKRIV